MGIEGVRERVRKILRFPVSDENELFTKEIMEHLLHKWVEVVSSYPYQVRSEGDLAIHWYETNLEDREDAEDLEWDAHNLEGWIKRARKVFLKHVHPVVHMHIVSPSEREKHWPREDLTDEQVTVRSLSLDSLFLPAISPTHMAQTMWLLVGRHFEDGLQKKHKPYYVGFGRVIGASRGELVEWVCFDVDFRVPHFHAYPVTSDEVVLASSDRLSDWGVEFGKLVAEKPSQQP